MFIPDSDDEKSTGQKIIGELDVILENFNSSILLLDEWDANLDMRNINALNGYINEVAKDNLIIEVRHRVDDAVISNQPA